VHTRQFGESLLCTECLACNRPGLGSLDAISESMVFWGTAAGTDKRRFAARENAGRRAVSRAGRDLIREESSRISRCGGHSGQLWRQQTMASQPVRGWHKARKADTSLRSG